MLLSVFAPNVINKLNLISDGFEIETEMIVKALSKGYRIKEIPINNGFIQRDSYVNTIIDGLKIGLVFLNGAIPKGLRSLNDFLIKKLSIIA